MIDASMQEQMEIERQAVVRRQADKEFFDTLIARAHHASIKTHDGWWYRYTVHRTVGIGIPENSCSLHRTPKGAQRAARRWRAREYMPTIIEA